MMAAPTVFLDRTELVVLIYRSRASSVIDSRCAVVGVSDRRVINLWAPTSILGQEVGSRPPGHFVDTCS